MGAAISTREMEQDKWKNQTVKKEEIHGSISARTLRGRAIACRARTHLQLVTILGALAPLAFALTSVCEAETLAQDNAANPAYNADNAVPGDDGDPDDNTNGWASGDNGGIGWAGGWSLTLLNGALAVVGNSASNGNGDTSPPIGDINTPQNANGRAWGLHAGSNGNAVAVRSFNDALKIGQSVRFSFDNGVINGDGLSGMGQDGVVRAHLTNTSGGDLWILNAIGGEADYIIQDASITVHTGIPLTDDGLEILFTLTSATSYKAKINVLGSDPVTIAGNLLNSGGDQAITDVQFQAFNGVGPGHARTAYFNNIAILPLSPEDFNRDGNPDYALFRSADRKTAIWYLNDSALARSAFGPSLPAGWTLVDSGDFNGDDQNDYLLFNSSTRQTAVWFLANATFTGSAFGPTLPAGWPLVGATNFNPGLDETLDYLLFKPATRQTAIWYLDGTSLVSSTFGPTLPSGWSLIGAAHFNDDKRVDYALFHPATRKTAVWYLSGGAVIGSAYGPTAPSGWEVVGVSDFNLNGQPDFVLFRPSTRQTALWHLNGTSFVSAAYGPTLPSGWQLIAP